MPTGRRSARPYTPTDLGIDTAVIASRRDGRWEARLYYGPEPDEHRSETFDREATADRLAVEHSLSPTNPAPAEKGTDHGENKPSNQPASSPR